jgi:hypothetical protein
MVCPKTFLGMQELEEAIFSLCTKCRAIQKLRLDVNCFNAFPSDLTCFPRKSWTESHALPKEAFNWCFIVDLFSVVFVITGLLPSLLPLLCMDNYWWWFVLHSLRPKQRLPKYPWSTLRWVKTKDLTFPFFSTTKQTTNSLHVSVSVFTGLFIFSNTLNREWHKEQSSSRGLKCYYIEVQLGSWT